MITPQEIKKLDKELKADGKPSLKDIENILGRRIKSSEYYVYLNKHLGYSSLSDVIMPALTQTETKKIGLVKVLGI